MPTAFEAVEDSESMGRLFCRGYREFTMRVRDAEGALFLQLTRPARFPGGIFWGVPPFGGCWAAPQEMQARAHPPLPCSAPRSPPACCALLCARLAGPCSLHVPCSQRGGTEGLPGWITGRQCWSCRCRLGCPMRAAPVRGVNADAAGAGAHGGRAAAGIRPGELPRLRLPARLVSVGPGPHWGDGLCHPHRHVRTSVLHAQLPLPQLHPGCAPAPAPIPGPGPVPVPVPHSHLRPLCKCAHAQNRCAFVLPSSVSMVCGAAVLWDRFRESDSTYLIDARNIPLQPPA